MFELLLKNGTIATHYGVFEGSIAVKDGKIAQIISKGAEAGLQAEEVLDCTGKVIMPGCIDSHVHMWDPGQTQRDDWGSATYAALYGGITTILEHPLSIPPVDTLEHFRVKYDIAAARSHTDFGLWAAMLPGNSDHFSELKDAGCVAFKGFISYANENYPHVTDSQLFAGMEKLREIGGIAAVHAENADMAYMGADRLKAEGRVDPLAHLESRESIVELEAINKAILFSEWLQTRMHIVHMSIHEGAESIKQAKRRGVPITAETCPHFLTSDVGLLERKGPFALCTPPLRRPENTEKLWEYIFDGTLDFIASDHSCYSREEKNRGKDSIWEAEPGLPGVETMLPMMWDASVKRNLPLTRFVELMSTNVAKVFRVYPQKGAILPGSDADFCVIDPQREWTITDAGVHYKCGWTPFDGTKLKGAVDATIIRGNIAMSGGEVRVGPGFGQYVRP